MVSSVSLLFVGITLLAIFRAYPQDFSFLLLKPDLCKPSSMFGFRITQCIPVVLAKMF